ncbi:hypothetical protein [Cylindrospermopsis raciborskii]|nr:hypothetical protein [Cylindrospermopsis raciborskii]
MRAPQHIQNFPLRRNWRIITESDRPSGVQCDRSSVCSSFSLEKNPRESS